MTIIYRPTVKCLHCTYRLICSTDQTIKIEKFDLTNDCLSSVYTKWRASLFTLPLYLYLYSLKRDREKEDVEREGREREKERVKYREWEKEWAREGETERARDRKREGGGQREIKRERCYLFISAYNG